MKPITLTCDKCRDEIPSYIDLVKHYRFAHGLSLADACAAAERRKPMKTIADAVAEHNRQYGIETR